MDKNIGRFYISAIHNGYGYTLKKDGAQIYIVISKDLLNNNYIISAIPNSSDLRWRNYRAINIDKTISKEEAMEIIDKKINDLQNAINLISNPTRELKYENQKNEFEKLVRSVRFTHALKKRFEINAKNPEFLKDNMDYQKVCRGFKGMQRRLYYYYSYKAHEVEEAILNLPDIFYLELGFEINSFNRALTSSVLGYLNTRLEDLIEKKKIMIQNFNQITKEMS